MQNLDFVVLLKNVDFLLKNVDFIIKIGVISRPELKDGLRQLNMGLSATQIDDVLTFVDKDGDGQINYFEFVRQFGDHQTAGAAGRGPSPSVLPQSAPVADPVVDLLHTEVTAQDGEIKAVEHILSQLAQEFGMFDDAKARVHSTVDAGEIDPHELCDLLDVSHRGFLTKEDFTSSNLSWASRFGIKASDLSELGWVLDFGVDDRLGFSDFFEQLRDDTVPYYGSGRRRTGAADAVPGPELEVTHEELAQLFREHNICAEQFALDLGAAFDAFIPWKTMADAMIHMGLNLTGPQLRSLARIRGSNGGVDGGVTLRDFGDEFKVDVSPDTVARDASAQIDEIVALMSLHGLDFREDVFMGAERMPSAVFRRRMRALLGPELVSSGAINALTVMLSTAGNDDNHLGNRVVGHVNLQAVLQSFAQKPDTAEHFDRSKREPLSGELFRRAVDSAAASDGICELPYQGLTDGSIKQWLHSGGHPNFRPKALSEAGALVQLDLSHNRIACSGAAAIARRLDDDRSLERLSLAHNKIDDAGAMQLALMVQGNQSLRCVDVSDNIIGRKGIAALRKARSTNPTNIIQLVLHGNVIDDVMEELPIPGAFGKPEPAKSPSPPVKSTPEKSAKTKRLRGKAAAVAEADRMTRKTLINVVNLGRRQRVD